MMNQTSRHGYTLIELMVTLMIFGLIMSSLAFAFIACIRLFNITMSESELALRTRELRDKLLFHSQATSDGVYYSGLLSGTNVTTSASSISMLTEAVTLGRRPRQAINLSLQGDEGEQYFANSAEADGVNWLIPGSFKLANAEDKNVITTINDRKGRPVRIYVNLTLKHELPGGSEITHHERVTIPVFQKYQPKWTGEETTR